MREGCVCERTTILMGHGTAFDTAVTYGGKLSQEDLFWHTLHDVGEGLEEILLPTWEAQDRNLVAGMQVRQRLAVTDQGLLCETASQSLVLSP